MSCNDNLDRSRRTVLRTLGSAGVAGVGAGALSSSVAAESDGIEKTDLDLERDGALETLRELDVVADDERSLSEAMVTGEQLLKTLRANDIIRASSLGNVVDRARDTYYREGKAGPEVHFRLPTGKGPLQITFDSEGEPFAAYYPEERSETTLFVIDGTEDKYKQLIHEPDANALDCGSNCGGCTCGRFCNTQPWNDRRYCQTCDNGECVTGRDCGC
ncbi:hypothetical protein [Natrialba asiatica]|uniref:Uncharacterized protein n=1 Tax=Natrialba asiatica (strain ATCC 700177 / DSM 12278 / JCM 9576 / FERM P-10747 / NBRC 102637 / 172P1) TaxID=29540 RepID=M0ALM1_NATA1|nr:hypothetical protein [Natrialba asiatica]ELY99434.1 hypothetical protein C481_14413 [Natrialba asiatica DSM 12278]